MTVFRIIALFLLAGCLSVAQAQRSPEPPTLDDFLADANFWGAELSPSGRYLSGVKFIDEQRYVVVFDLDDSELKASGVHIPDALVNWLEWTSDDRLLMAITMFMDGRGKQVPVNTLYADPSLTALPVRRLFSMDRNGENMVGIFAGNRRMQRNLYLSSVTDFLPNDPDHILMPVRLGNDLDLFKVNVVSGDYERVAKGTSRTIRWYTDDNGQPAFRLSRNRRGTILYVHARENRENGKIRWRRIKTIKLNQRRDGDEENKEFQPIAPGPDVTTYYVIATLEGRERAGLYLYDIEKNEYVETIKEIPEIDITNAIINRETGEYYGTTYYRDRLVIDYEDESLQSEIDSLGVYFGEASNFKPIDSSADGNRWLLYAFGPEDSGSYHIYYSDRHEVSELGSIKVSLSSKTLSPASIIRYEARDGLALTGYLTRPAATAPGEKPPLIMMPHGGPEMRDYYTFDFTAQLLAAHGYQVFQPNFRGSDGYGRAFADAGHREWGRAMQTDIEDGLAYLVAEGLVHPDRACILGASYGGYAALAAATLTPDTYACAISIAGPSDLIEMLKWERRESGRNSEEYEYWVKLIGHPNDDKEALRMVSPARLANRVSRPLMLIHGEDDGIVPIKQSELMERAMERAGKDVHFVRLENSGHSFRSDADERTEYEEMLAFLSEHLPVEQAVANSPQAIAEP